VRGEIVVFAAPFHPVERLFVLRRAGETLVSNSLVFLLAEAGDGLDLSHPTYFFDFVAQTRAGLAPSTLRTAAGSGRVFRCCNLEWNDEGAASEIWRLDAAGLLRGLLRDARRHHENSRAECRFAKPEEDIPPGSGLLTRL
jgi:hypothetical protein